MDTSAIRRARALRWEPTRPADLTEYNRCMDYELPGDDTFLARLVRECDQWLLDNDPNYSHKAIDIPPTT